MIKCCPPIIEQIEFDINPDLLIPINNSTIILPTQEVNLCELKRKIICDYYKILSDLRKGKSPDLTFLIDEISSVTISDEINSNILQYYLNNYG